MDRLHITKSKETSGKSAIIVIVALGVLLFPFCARSQDKWSVTLKSGVNIPTEKFEEAELKTGFGAEGTISYEFTGYLSGYGGWSWNKFNSTRNQAGNDLEFEETGYTFGVQFNYPATTSKITYLVGVGGVYNHLQVEDSEGNLLADSGHGLGTQVETGVIIMFSRHLELIPYGRYRALPDEFELDNIITSIDLRYFSFGVGLSWTF